MASTHRTAADLLEGLDEQPWQLGFFQLLRLIECAHPGMPRLGASQRPADDPIRLAHQPSLAFESATLTSFQPGVKGELPRLVSRFLGLLGPNGPLPSHLTEYARDRQRHHGDHTFARFLDIFHHRMLSLFYRAWANGDPAANFDRPNADRFAHYVGALAGLGMEGLRNRDCAADLDKCYFTGHLSNGTRHPAGLMAMLQDYFGVAARLKEFVGEWLDLPRHALCRLGEAAAGNRLGMSATLGAKVWSCQHKFRLIIGPLSYEEYQAMLPDGRWLSRLVALVRNYIGDELAWDLNLILKSAEIPTLRLDGASRLGWTSWLGEKCPDKDADNLVVNALGATGAYTLKLSALAVPPKG